MENQQNNRFNRRSFVAVALLVSGLLLPISGIKNHNLQFDPLTIQRHFWMAVHNFTAVLFVIMTIFHVYYNKTLLGRYLSSYKSRLVSREALAAFLFVIVLVGIFSSHVFHAG